MRKLLTFIMTIITTAIYSQNFISDNSSFKKGLSSWQFGVASNTNDTPDAEFEVVEEGQDDDSSCKVKVRINTESFNYNDAYLMYKGIPVKKGKKYRVAFYVKSNRPKDKVMVTIGSGSAPNIQILEDREQAFVGNSEWQKISFAFQASKNRNNVNFKDLSLFVGFNYRFGTFYVDNFSVTSL